MRRWSGNSRTDSLAGLCEMLDGLIAPDLN
jgi:hypothetical protein